MQKNSYYIKKFKGLSFTGLGGILAIIKIHYPGLLRKLGVEALVVYIAINLYPSGTARAEISQAIDPPVPSLLSKIND